MGRLFFILAITILLVFVLLFFPIYVQTNAHYDMNGRKLAFAIYLYRWFKLIGGYMATYQGGLALHVSQKKAILLPYAEMEDNRRRFYFLRSIRLKALTFTIETGAEYLFPMTLAQVLSRIYFFSKGGKKEKIENNVWLTDGDVLRISVKFVIRFNVFIMLRNFIMQIKEKLSCQKKIKKSAI